MMVGIRCVVFVVVLTSQWTLVRGDADVSCRFMETCVLPCSYSGTDVVIHWHQVSAGNLPVHSFYYNQDQLANQNQCFRKRTSLFKDQISRGNASLQLTAVKVQDEGRYKCYTSTLSGGHESFINLKIHAPVQKVDIQQVGNIITCSSEGIYPEPELTWSNMTSISTTVQQTEQQLYSIRSSLNLSDTDADLSYSCTISTDRSRKRATVFKPASILWSDTETTISCPPSLTPSSTVIWRFNHDQNIVTRTESSYRVHAGWEQHVKNVSESGSLTLQGLTSKHEGTYTCELSDAEETKISVVMVMIEPASKRIKDPTQSSHVGAIVGAIVFLAALAGLIVRKNHATEVQESSLSESRPVTEATAPPDGETPDTKHSS